VATSLVEREALAAVSPINETLVSFKYIGESDDEYRSVSGGEESARLLIKGYHPAKDGIVACLLAAKTLATGGTSLTKQLTACYQRTGQMEAARVGVLSSAQFMSSPSKVQQNPDIGSCLLKGLNRIGGAKVQFAGGASLCRRPSGNDLFVRNHAESESIDYLEVSS
jgi:phosphomannomutase